MGTAVKAAVIAIILFSAGCTTGQPYVDETGLPRGVHDSDKSLELQAIALEESRVEFLDALNKITLLSEIALRQLFELSLETYELNAKKAPIGELSDLVLNFRQVEEFEAEIGSRSSAIEEWTRDSRIPSYMALHVLRGVFESQNSDIQRTGSIVWDTPNELLNQDSYERDRYDAGLGSFEDLCYDAALRVSLLKQIIVANYDKQASEIIGARLISPSNEFSNETKSRDKDRDRLLDENRTILQEIVVLKSLETAYLKLPEARQELANAMLLLQQGNLLRESPAQAGILNKALERLEIEVANIKTDYGK